jgi:hypothetical protein
LIPIEQPHQQDDIMAIRQPTQGTEEERVCNWWWGGSIRGDPRPDEVTWSVMNTAFDTLKSTGNTEEMIYRLPDIDPNRFIGHGMLRVAQWDALRKNPAERAAKNAAL